MAINVDISKITGINQVGNSYQRKSAVPLDYYSLFNTKAEAEAYAASNPVSYVGQVISYIDGGEVKVCVIANADGLLKEVGTAPVGAENGAINVTESGEVSVNVDGKSIAIANNKIAMHAFGTAYYEYVPEVKDEEGNVTQEASYAKVEVSESKPWKAGLEPKVVTENGQLVIGWFEPNPTTIEGVNDQVTAVQGTVADLEASVGVPSAEGQEATGLYKEVEDVQAEVEDLADSVGTSEDALGDNVDTLWAHVNDHEGRIAELESKVEPTAEAIEAAQDRADAAYALAEKKVDAEAYATDKKALQDEDAAIRAIAEGARDTINTFLNSEEIDETVNTLKELQAEIEKMTDATELTQALASKADVDSVYTKEETNDLLDEKQDVIPENTYDAYGAAAAAQSAAEAKAAELATAAKEAAIEDAKKYEAKADASAVYTKEEADALINVKANAADVYAKSETYTQKQVDELLEGIQAGSSESAASVNTKLEALKKTLNNEIYGNDEGTGDSRIDTAEAKLAGIAEGAQVNVIESVAVADAEKSRLIVSTVGKAVSIDDSGLRTDIADAKKAGTDAATVASQAVQAAGENANKIQTNINDITNLKTLTGEHTEKISAIESANSTHDAEFKALKSTVEGHTSTLAGKAEQSALNEVSAKASANEQAIKTLNETTIPGVNAEIAKKANSADVYTKAEIGTIASNKTIVEMIADAQAAATYNDSEVRGLIGDNATAIENITKEGGAIDTAVAAEAAIARAAEKKNADDIAAINAVLNTVDSEDTITSLKELAIWVEEHGGEASKMAEAIEDNADAIAAINDETNGVLAQAKAHSDANLATAKAYADAEIAKVHGVDDKTIKLAENKAYVAEVSTDILVQGAQELVLCGGNASGFATV